MNKARLVFEEMSKKYDYPYAIENKSELIEYVIEGVAALSEDETDMEHVQEIGLAIQGQINSSKLYDTNEELQYINDDLLTYEDFNRVRSDELEINDIFEEFKQYIKDLPDHLERVL